MTDASNELLCPRCGDVKVRTPPGTTALPTIGLARKAAGAGECDCGRRTNEHPDTSEHPDTNEHRTATEEAP